MIQKLTSILLVVALIFSFAACAAKPSTPENTEAGKSAEPVAATDTTQPVAKKPKQGDKWKIGFSISFTGNAFRALCLATLEQEIEKRGDVDFVILDGQNDINKQVSDLENLIAMDVDGIMILPGSSEALESTLIEARGKGIPVGVFDKEILNKEAYDFYVGPDTVDQSHMATEWLFQKMGGKGNIIQLGGTPGNSSTTLCLEDCQNLIDSKYPDIKILAYKDTSWKEDTAKQVVTDLLLAYPGQIDGIWSDGSQSTAGAIKACLAANVEPIPMIGNTAYAGILRLFVENKDKYPNWDVALGSKPASEASDCLNDLIDLLEGKKLDGQDLNLKSNLLVLSEVGEELYNPDLPDSMYVDHTLTPENLQKLLQTDTMQPKK